MSMLDFCRRNSRRLAWAAQALLCALVTYASVAYFNSNPHPDVHARLGVVSIDLAGLDYKLTFAELQSAGMFLNTSCRKCDFSAKGSESFLEDREDARFMGFMGRSHRTLWLTFFGENIPVGQRQLDVALQALREKFPGREDAIKLVFRGFEDNQRFDAVSSPP
ncbi:MAG: hypothetical protein ABI645_04140 [Pseudomonadota bacterium]